MNENINIGKREGFDFSKHVHTVRILKDENGNECRYDIFKKPNTNFDSIIFINTYGVLTVTGDYGNWIFCREFHPSPKSSGGVSNSYWDEKLHISSHQKSHHYCENKTIELLEEKIKELEEYDSDNSLIEYYKNCLDNIDAEFHYTKYAYENLPDGYDHEYMIIGKVRDIQLTYIYDAFDVICERLKQNENDR